MRVLILLNLFLCACTCISLQVPVKEVYVGWEMISWNNVTGSIVTAPVESGFNCIILNFFAPYTKEGFDAMEAWKTVSPAAQQVAIDYAHSKGAVVMGGVKLSSSYGDPYTQNATALGIEFATWAKQYLLDGIDINFQDINQGFTVNAGINLTQWAIDLITAAKGVLGPDLILTVAAPPVSFGPAGYADTYAGVTGGLLGVYKAVPDMINYIFLWYFLQPADCVSSYQVLFVTTSGVTDCYPQTAVNELIQAGLPSSKAVVAIAVQPGDVSGYVDPTSFGQFVSTANTSLGWNSGIGAWNWQGETFLTSWLNMVYPAPSVSTTTTAATTTGSTTTGEVVTTPAPATTTTTGADPSTTTTSSSTAGVSTTTASTTSRTTTITGAVSTSSTTTGSTTSDAAHISRMGWVVVAVVVSACVLIL